MLILNLVFAQKAVRHIIRSECMTRPCRLELPCPKSLLGKTHKIIILSLHFVEYERTGLFLILNINEQAKVVCLEYIDQSVPPVYLI